MRRMDVKFQHVNGPNEMPATAILPSGEAVQLIAFGGRSRVEAAALEILARLAANPKSDLTDEDMIERALELADLFVAEVDRRQNAARGVQS